MFIKQPHDKACVFKIRISNLETPEKPLNSIDCKAI